MELGNKSFRWLLKKKVRILPMDLSKQNLGLTDKNREELVNCLNIIINSAGTVEFDTRLDI